MKGDADLLDAITCEIMVWCVTTDEEILFCSSDLSTAEGYYMGHKDASDDASLQLVEVTPSNIAFK